MAQMKWYGNALLLAMRKQYDFLNDNVKIMMCTSAYTPNQDLHIYKSDITNEITGTGYTAGGISLTGKSLTYNASTNQIVASASNISIANSTLAARYIVAYVDTGIAASSPLLGYVDLVTDQISTNGPFNITFDPTGIFQINVA